MFDLVFREPRKAFQDDGDALPAPCYDVSTLRRVIQATREGRQPRYPSTKAIIEPSHRVALSRRPLLSDPPSVRTPDFFFKFDGRNAKREWGAGPFFHVVLMHTGSDHLVVAYSSGHIVTMKPEGPTVDHLEENGIDAASPMPFGMNTDLFAYATSNKDVDNPQSTIRYWNALSKVIQNTYTVDGLTFALAFTFDRLGERVLTLDTDYELVVRQVGSVDDRSIPVENKKDITVAFFLPKETPERETSIVVAGGLSESYSSFVRVVSLGHEDAVENAVERERNFTNERIITFACLSEAFSGGDPFSKGRFILCILRGAYSQLYGVELVDLRDDALKTVHTLDLPSDFVPRYAAFSSDGSARIAVSGSIRVKYGIVYVFKLEIPARTEDSQLFTSKLTHEMQDPDVRNRGFEFTEISFGPNNRLYASDSHANVFAWDLGPAP